MLIVFTLISAVSGSIEAGTNRQVAEYTRPSGRMVEVYSEIFLTSLDEDARDKLKRQGKVDVSNDEYTPLIESKLTESTPWGKINLGNFIHRGEFTTLFSIKEFPNLIIKYQAHCVDIQSEIHPLLKDFWYMHEASGFGMAPRPRFVSPPSDLCEINRGKCSFTMSEFQWELCQSERAALRYMIMDRADGMSLHGYRERHFWHSSGAMDFASVMAVGIRLIQLLRKLHTEVRVVHGDIHSPNVMINITNGTTGEFNLSLIDFGIASRYNDSPLPTVPIRRPFHFYHELHTQWQIDGFAWAARDDLLKAIQTIAQLMHPFWYFEFERMNKEAGSRILREWKMVHNWFLSAGRDPVKFLQIPDGHKARIYELLETILTIGRGMNINGPLPYRQLESIMVECLRIARGAPPRSFTTTAAPEIVQNTTLPK